MALKHISLEQLVSLAQQATNFSDLLRKCGLTPSGGNHRSLVQKLALLGIDTSHFTGRAWSKGLTATANPALSRQRTPDSEVFVQVSSMPSGKVAKRLKKLGWEFKCYNIDCPTNKLGLTAKSVEFLFLRGHELPKTFGPFV